MHDEAESEAAPCAFAPVIELYLEDMQGLARLTTKRSVVEYRRTVRTHAEDANGTDPRETTREHVKATLRRWSHPEPEHYILPGTRWTHSACGYVPVERPERPCDRKTVWRTVRRLGRRAGIGTPVHPHQLRHAFADRVTRLAGLHASRALLGHASIQTTEGYLTRPSPDELVDAMARVTLAAVADRQRNAEVPPHRATLLEGLAAGDITRP